MSAHQNNFFLSQKIHSNPYPISSVFGGVARMVTSDWTFVCIECNWSMLTKQKTDVIACAPTCILITLLRPKFQTAKNVNVLQRPFLYSTLCTFRVTLL